MRWEQGIWSKLAVNVGAYRGILGSVAMLAERDAKKMHGELLAALIERALPHVPRRLLNPAGHG